MEHLDIVPHKSLAKMQFSELNIILFIKKCIYTPLIGQEQVLLADNDSKVEIGSRTIGQVINLTRTK